jgi:predicted dehydrogenase
MNIYDFIRSGKDPLTTKPDFPTFEDGYRENVIIDAILQSNIEKKWIEV